MYQLGVIYQFMVYKAVHLHFHRCSDALYSLVIIIFHKITNIYVVEIN